MAELAPIVLFVYKRPYHTRKTLEALSENVLADKSTLYIFVEGMKKGMGAEQVAEREEVLALVKEKKWCGRTEIIERTTNLGLSGSILRGISETLEKHDKVIVLEDDIVTSKGFLTYMNEALSLYEEHAAVKYISGFMYPVKKRLPDTFFSMATCTWGWATWKRAWNQNNTNSAALLQQLLQSGRTDEFTMQGRNYLLPLLERNAGFETKMKGIARDEMLTFADWTWDICWLTSLFLENSLSLHPGQSLVRNIGHDATGVHCKESWWSEIYNNHKIADTAPVKQIPLIIDKNGTEAIARHYAMLTQPGLIIKAKEKLKLMLKKA